MEEKELRYVEFSDKEIEFLHCLLCAGYNELQDDCAGSPWDKMTADFGIDITPEEFEERKKKIETVFDFDIS